MSSVGIASGIPRARRPKWASNPLQRHSPPLSQSPCGPAVNPGSAASAASAGANAINQGQFNFLPSSNGVVGPGLPENVPPRSGSTLPGASPGTSSFSFITTASSSTLPGLTRTDSSTDGLLGQTQTRNCQLELQLEQREQELQNARTQAQQSNSEAARLQGELLQLQGRLEVAVTAMAGFESAFRAVIATTRHLVAQRATEDIREVFEQQIQTLTMSTVDLKASLETVSQNGSGVVTVPLVSEWGRGADGLSSSESPPASARPSTAASGTGMRRTSSSMEEEAAAVRLQARARGNLERHSIERREKLSHELLQSEGTYLAGLRVVIDGYWRPLQHALNAGHEMVTGLQQADLQRIFSEVQSIAALHEKEIHKPLTERIGRATWSPTSTCLGDIMGNRKTIQHLKIHGLYAKNYFQAVRTLSDAKAASPQFASWLTRQAEKIGSGSWTGGSGGFSDTRQRIPRYEMLLDELQKATPETHPDCLLIKEAYTAMKQLAQAVNQRQHDEEALDRVLTVQALFNKTVEGAALPLAQQGFPGGFELVQPHRKWLKEGVLTLHVDKATTATSAAATEAGGVQRQFFLFNDLLLMATLVVSIRERNALKRASKNSTVSHASYCGMLQISTDSTVQRLNAATLRIRGAGTGLAPISVKESSSEWILQASSEAEAKEWEAKLREAINYKLAIANRA